MRQQNSPRQSLAEAGDSAQVTSEWHSYAGAIDAWVVGVRICGSFRAPQVEKATGGTGIAPGRSGLPSVSKR